MRINVFVAVRLGSRRVPFKNFRLLGGKPLYEFATKTATSLESTNHVFLNTDSPLAIEIARERFGDKLRYHLRPAELGTSSAKLDSYVYEFMVKNPSDYTVFINPCSLFLSSSTIDQAISYTVENDLDSCVSSRVGQTHAFLNNEAINFRFDEPQPRSQDLTPVHLMTSGFFIWRNKCFLENYRNTGYANFSGKFESYPISDFEAVDIDTEKDFEFASRLLGIREGSKAEFHPRIKTLIDLNVIHPN